MVTFVGDGDMAAGVLKKVSLQLRFLQFFVSFPYILTLHAIKNLNFAILYYFGTFDAHAILKCMPRR